MAYVSGLGQAKNAERFARIKDSLAGLSRIALLKALEKHASEIFVAEEVVPCFPADQHERLIAAVNMSQFRGVEEFSPEFFATLAFASKRQDVMRDFVLLALGSVEHGFDAFDAALLEGCAHISHHYDGYYRAWAAAVQGNEVAKRLAENPPPQDSPLVNNYTIIQLAEDGSFYDKPYGVFFASELAPVLAAFDVLIQKLSNVPEKTAEQARYVEYFEQYRAALGEKDRENLEAQWKELDMVWMDIKYHIQVIHDIEYGYGDPLRIKCIPDFSIRFVDEEYDAANKMIATIQGDMVEYFRKRESDLSRKGLFALASSFAAIYYLPFQSGMSLHFRFSGQSIPNRAEVKDLKGVKIYFDPVSTGNRQVTAKALAEAVYVNAADITKDMTATNTIVYHVAAHEIGHAIYGLGHVASVLQTATKTLLEEPRAELTSLATMRLLLQTGRCSLEEIQSHLASFAVQDLRRFAGYKNVSTRPYTISAINTYNTYFATGYVRFADDDKTRIVLDVSKTEAVLDVLAGQFESILDAEDRLDGPCMEEVLATMQTETEITHWLVGKLYTPPQ